MSTLTLLTPPANEPVSFLDVRDFLRARDSDEEIVNALVPMARDYVETQTGRALITQTWRLDFHDGFDTDTIKLPKAPLQTIDTFTYYDSDNVQQTLTGADYEIAKSQTFASTIRMRDGASWPALYNRFGAASITFTCGYGATGTSVPKQLIRCMWLLLLDFFENRNARGLSADGTPMQLPKSPAIVDRCLLGYRVFSSCKSVD